MSKNEEVVRQVARYLHGGRYATIRGARPFSVHDRCFGENLGSFVHILILIRYILSLICSQRSFHKSFLSLLASLLLVSDLFLSYTSLPLKASCCGIV